MVVTLPIVIGAGIVGILSLLSITFGGELRRGVRRASSGFQKDLDRANVSLSAEEYMLGTLSFGAIAWIGIVLLLRHDYVASALAFPACEGVAVALAVFSLRFMGARRISRFVDQLEAVLTMIAAAMRVGLGFRQAIILVTEEIPNPAQTEFMRVLGRSNIGIPLVDALDELAQTLPAEETDMMARIIRVQQQTGGDLAKVLEKLAGTIRERRRILRRIKAMTAQGRFGAMIIGALPVVVGGFIVATQKDMGDVLLFTEPGWIVLGGVALLEVLAIITMAKILQLDV